MLYLLIAACPVLGFALWMVVRDFNRTAEAETKAYEDRLIEAVSLPVRGIAQRVADNRGLEDQNREYADYRRFDQDRLISNRSERWE